MKDYFRLYNLAKKEDVVIQEDRSALMFVLEGEVQLVGLKDKQAEVLRNSVSLLPIASKVLIRSKNKARVLIVSFDPTNYFSIEYTQELLRYSSNESISHIDLKDNLMPFLRSVLSYIDDAADMTELSELLRAEMFVIIRLYYSQEDISGLFSPVLNTDLAFKQLVMRHCLQTETLDGLAALTRYSKSGFIKKFHRCFGVSPYKWILDYKVKRILQEIQLSNKQFKQIADDYGISNLSYFYTFCKKHFGKSPSAMRKEGKMLRKQ